MKKLLLFTMALVLGFSVHAQDSPIGLQIDNLTLLGATTQLRMTISQTTTEDGLIWNASNRRWRMTVGGDKSPTNGAFFQILYKNHNASTYTPHVTINHSNGAMGLGTTNPTQKLDVNGNVKANQFIGDGSQLTGISSTGSLWRESEGSVYRTGKVGIGNSEPIAPLHVTSIAQGSAINRAVYAEATGGNNAPNFALWGKAERNTRSYAGYFDGFFRVLGSNLSDFFVFNGTAIIDGGLDFEPKLDFWIGNNRGTGNSITAAEEGFTFTGGQKKFLFKNASGFSIDSKIDDPVSMENAVNYGIDLTSGSHGISISLAGNTTKDNAFVGFFDEDTDKIRGSITGVTSFGEVNWGECLKSYFDNLLQPDPSSSTSSDVGPGAEQSGNWANTEDQDQSGELTKGAATAIKSLDGLDCGPISISSLYEIISKGVDVVRDGITFASSVFSTPFDIEDIWSQGLTLYSSSYDFGSYLDYILNFNGVTYETGNGDYAEYLIRYDETESITHGEIVGVKSGEVSKTFLDADHFMAVSTAPAIAGAVPVSGTAHLYEKVAFLGQVPIKVMGKVNKGDYILPSGEGDGLGISVAPKEMLALDFHRIVGIAWDESDGKEHYKMINTAVGINQNDLANMVEQLQVTVNALQLAMNRLDPDFELDLLTTSGRPLGKGELANSNGYSVSPTHPSRIDGLFDGTQFASQDEAIDAVRTAWKEVAHINVEENEMVSFILDNRENVTQVIEYYSGVLQQLQGAQQGISEQLFSAH